MPDGVQFWLLGALSGLVGTAALLDGMREGRRALSVAALCLGLLMGRSVLAAHPAWEVALLPWRAYAAFADFWVWPLAVAFFALLIGVARPGIQRRLVATLTCLVLLSGAWSQRWMVTGLASEGSLVRADAQHHCVQSARDTCAPAACVSLLSYWGIDASEGELVHRCLAAHGTTIFDAYRGLCLSLGERALRVRVLELDLADVLHLGVPLLFNDGSHARVLVVADGQCLVHDPALQTPEVWPLDRVARHLRGPVIAIEATDGARPAPPIIASTARR